MISRVLLPATFLLVCACGGSPAPAPDRAAPVASAEPAAGPAPTAAPEAIAPAAASAEAAAPPPAASSKPASHWKIGDKSLSTVDVDTVKAALEKAGYATLGAAEIVTCGEVETLQVGVTRQGKPVGIFSLQRPAAKPDDCKPTSVKEAYELWKKSAEGPQAKNALTFDDAASVLVAINLMKDEPGAAKKLMESLVTK